MNVYLTRLGIRPEIQEWLAPYYYTNSSGHLCFTYGVATETYGLGFHHAPLKGCWMAGSHNAIIRRVILCSSAMEGAAWLNFHTVNLDHIQIVATNTFHYLPKGNYTLAFGNDLLGHVYDLKAAAALTGQPVAISASKETVHLTFRFRNYQLPLENFSLNAFERLSGYRFNAIKTSKPSRHSSWLNQLLSYGND